jgi:hypothetical protein
LRRAARTARPFLFLSQFNRGVLMRFPVRPGKVTCAGVVAILMVLPNSIWKGADANVTRPAAQKVETRRPIGKASDSPRVREKLRRAAR